MALKLVAAATAPLVTLAEAKRHVRAVDFDDDNDYIQSLIDVASAHIDAPSGWLGRAVGESTWELRLHCFPCGKIDIPLPPLKSVDSVEYVDVDGVARTYTTFREFGVESANFPGFILPAYDENWPDTRSDEPEAVRITFAAGYAEVPKPIKHAVLLMVGDWYKNRADATEIKLAEMPRGVDALLAPFRVWA